MSGVYERVKTDLDYLAWPRAAECLAALPTLRFIPGARPVLFHGPPGCGKTHLAVALERP